MPIGKSFYIKTAKAEIEKLLESQFSDEYKRTNVGRILFKLAKMYGNESANQLIEEYQLEKINIKPVI